MISLRLPGQQSKGRYAHIKGGRRADLGNEHFRSAWEANYARYLNLLKSMGIVVKWEHEPVTFWFKGIKRGTVSYLPDFRVVYREQPFVEYVEVKGRIERKDKTKWKRMAAQYPEVKLTIIGKKEYAAIKRKWGGLNWE